MTNPDPPTLLGTRSDLHHDAITVMRALQGDAFTLHDPLLPKRAWIEHHGPAQLGTLALQQLAATHHLELSALLEAYPIHDGEALPMLLLEDELIHCTLGHCTAFAPWVDYPMQLESHHEIVALLTRPADAPLDPEEVSAPYLYASRALRALRGEPAVEIQHLNLFFEDDISEVTVDLWHTGRTPNDFAARLAPHLRALGLRLTLTGDLRGWKPTPPELNSTEPYDPCGPQLHHTPDALRFTVPRTHSADVARIAAMHWREWTEPAPWNAAGTLQPWHAHALSRLSELGPKRDRWRSDGDTPFRPTLTGALEHWSAAEPLWVLERPANPSRNPEVLAARRNDGHELTVDLTHLGFESPLGQLWPELLRCAEAGRVLCCTDPGHALRYALHDFADRSNLPRLEDGLPFRLSIVLEGLRLLPLGVPRLQNPLFFWSSEDDAVLDGEFTANSNGDWPSLERWCERYGQPRPGRSALSRARSTHAVLERASLEHRVGIN